MSTKTTSILFLLAGWWIALATSCSSNETTENNPNNEEYLPAAPNYADSRYWYQAPETGDKPADVFYVVPTCIWNWEAETGDTSYYMNPLDEAQREAVDRSEYLGYALFSKSCRFFAPYYRQISMEAWMQSPSEIERRYQNAHQDIVAAFRYYMDNLNQGRPFILAGHSQGAKAVIELLKHTLTADEYERLVAAYAFGFSVSQEELDRYPYLRPANDSIDTPALICYNSVSRPEAVSPLFANNRAIINPLNWRTDETPAAPAENRGSVFFHADQSSDTLFQTVGARIDRSLHALIIEGLNDEDYFIPSIQSLFPKGNYHVQEINLYFLNLQQNLERRVHAYTTRKGA